MDDNTRVFPMLLFSKKGRVTLLRESRAFFRTNRARLELSSRYTYLISSIAPLYNYKQQFVAINSFFLLWGIKYYEEDANTFLTVNYCLCSLSLHGAHWPHCGIFLLMHVFFSFRHSFLWDLPDDPQYHTYFFCYGNGRSFQWVKYIFEHTLASSCWCMKP